MKVVTLQALIFAGVVLAIMSIERNVSAHDLPEQLAVKSMPGISQATDVNTQSTPTVLEASPERVVSGKVSWYGGRFHGRKTANGERFNKETFSAAHRSLPFGSIVKVIDPRSQRFVIVRINDRGPYTRTKILDLSEAAYRELNPQSERLVLEFYSPQAAPYNSEQEMELAATEEGKMVWVAEKALKNIQGVTCLAEGFNTVVGEPGGAGSLSNRLLVLAPVDIADGRSTPFGVASVSGSGHGAATDIDTIAGVVN